MRKRATNPEGKKIAIVTGGSRGIGKAIVKKLAKLGNIIVVADYIQTDAHLMQTELAEQGIYIDVYKADISKKKDIESLVQYTLDKYGIIDILVNNAGISQYNMLQDITDEEFDQITKVNMYGPFAMCRAVADTMVQNQSGCIINISSIWGQTGAAMESVYSMTKAAVDALTKSLAKELGPSGIRVNSVSPGIIDTDMNSEWTKEELEEIKEQIPLGKIGMAEDIAECVAWLVEKDKYTTGQVISINGGWKI